MYLPFDKRGTWAMHMLALSGLLALGTVTGRRVGGEEWADALRV